MKLIAHRGLTRGPNKHLENRPATIMSAIEQGFDCEVDLWVFDNRLYLGHDGPQYDITHEFIRQSKLWIHCKHLPALEFCAKQDNLNYFWHQEDSYTLTSKGYIWTYPDKEVSTMGVMVMPEWHDPTFEQTKYADCYAICSDYVLKLKDIIPSVQSR